VEKVTAYTKNVEDLVKRYPKVAKINDRKITRHLGTYAKTATRELFAEASGHVHARGRRAPKLARVVTEPLGDLERIQAAAPDFLRAVRRLDQEVDHETGLQRRARRSLLARLRQVRALTERQHRAKNAAHPGTHSGTHSVTHGQQGTAAHATRPESEARTPPTTASLQPKPPYQSSVAVPTNAAAASKGLRALHRLAGHTRAAPRARGAATTANASEAAPVRRTGLSM
jgi:hypothetical protein